MGSLEVVAIVNNNTSLGVSARWRMLLDKNRVEVCIAMARIEEMVPRKMILSRFLKKWVC